VTALLELDNVDVRYGGVHAVRGLSLSVEPDETVVLIGANGAGKSSVLHTVIGTVRAASGAVIYRGRDITRSSTNHRACNGIRLSPEGRRVFASLSVEDNVYSGCYGTARATRRATLDWLFDTFPLLRERRHQPAGTLSGGQQQIVALARALAAAPDLLLLDEPFLGLSPIAIRDTSAAIRDVQRRGTAILLSEQMARPALALADRGYVLRTGALRRSGPVAEIRGLALAEDYL
jgi:branched-chain amino acid transport system ATP-binding protein